MTKIVSREELGQDAWDAAVEDSPEAWLWHLWDLIDGLRTWPGYRDHSFAILSDRGEVEALVPVYALESRRFGGLLKFRSLDVFGGVAHAPTLGETRRRAADEAAMAELARLAATTHAIGIGGSLPTMAPAWRGPEGPRVNPLLNLGWQDCSSQTWVIDLRQGVDALWKSMEGRARTSVRKAEASGLIVRRSTDPAEWRSYYEMHLETYRRTGAEHHSSAYFQTIWEKLIPTSRAYVLFAESDGELIAAVNVGVYKRGCVYWTGCSRGDARESNATSLLLWTAIKNLANEDFADWFDAGEAFPNIHTGKLHQLSEFKKSFGGILYPFFRGRQDVPNKIYVRLRHLRGLVTGRLD